MYIADSPLYQQYFPGPTPTSPPPGSAPYPASSMLNQAPSQQRFTGQYPLAPPHHSSSQYSSMPPPGSMPPPLSSSSSMSGPPGSAMSTLPPHPLLPSPAMSMPPPSSASSNGTPLGNGVPGRSSASRRPSSASSSRSRGRGDRHGSAHSAVGIPLAPEDMPASSLDAGGRTPRRTVTPTAMGSGMDAEDLPLRSPRVNGAPTAVVQDRRAPNVLANGRSPRHATPRQSEVREFLD